MFVCSDSFRTPQANFSDRQQFKPKFHIYINYMIVHLKKITILNNSANNNRKIGGEYTCYTWSIYYKDFTNLPRSPYNIIYRVCYFVNTAVMIACMFIHQYNHFYYGNAAQGHTERNPITNQPSTHNSNITSQFGPIPISKTVLSCKTGPKVDLVVLSVNPHIRSNVNILSMKYSKMLSLIKLEVTMLRV